MSIETYNRMRNVQHVSVSHNYTITGGLADDAFIKKVLNVRAFVCPVKKQVKLMVARTVTP